MSKNEYVLPMFRHGKKENSFYVKPDYPTVDRFGMQSDNGDGCYIYEWDAEKQKHIQKWIEK